MSENLSKLINEQGKPSRIIMAIREPNIGLIVIPKEYLGYHIEGEMVTMDGEQWGCIITDHYWRIFHEGSEIETMFGKSKVSFIPDRWMRPLPQVDTDSSVHTSKDVTA